MGDERRYFDSAYGIASTAIAVTGNTIVSTSQAYYHGIAAVPAAANYTVTIYDNISTAAGSILDVILVGSAGTGVRLMNYIPVVAKNGITVVVTGTAGAASVFYNPKG